ncbi:hypothetical protein ACFQGE_11185 [Halomicroarcula sp. GCM10025817]|uniref:hypothetical protein n=1 Tax=Haloarcula TaxID=2237 RepID=UPI0023E7C9DD|nr:hypothetical protein [Halomicroarcula sp. SYNS111]
MTESDETVRCWLVERSSYGDERVVTLVYATPEGDRQLKKQLSTNLLMQKAVTAAVDVDPGRLEPVEDAETRDRYATEASRMAEQHDPGEEV